MSAAVVAEMATTLAAVWTFAEVHLSRCVTVDFGKYFSDSGSMKARSYTTAIRGGPPPHGTGSCALQMNAFSERHLGSTARRNRYQGSPPAICANALFPAGKGRKTRNPTLLCSNARRGAESTNSSIFCSGQARARAPQSDRGIRGDSTMPDVPSRVLLGPGPANIHPRVMRALQSPVISHVDPEFMRVLAGISSMLRGVFEIGRASC